MAEDIKSPQFPESIFEGTLSSWLKKEGDSIEQDEVLAEIETDKVVIEVTATKDGVMEKIIAPEGSTIKSSEVIATFVEGNKISKVSVQNNKDNSKKHKVLSKKEKVKEEISKDIEKNIKNLEETKTTVDNSSISKGLRMGPAAKKLLLEKDIDPEFIKATSKKGLVTKNDVLNAQTVAEDTTKTNDTKINAGFDSKRVPMTRLRSLVAKRLVESQQQTASLTTFNEVDLMEVKNLREKYKESFQKKYDVKLGFMGLFLKAASIALQDMPIVNASIDDDDVIYHGFQDIGVAVSTERGLVVPVVRGVQNKNIAEIEQSILELSNKAREGSLSIEEMTGGTFTVSNGGVFGSLMSTPILNPPQSAILGMHKIQDRPVAINGTVVIRPMMYLALTYDHRLLDGKDAVTFLVKMKESLESPESMILGV
jgi:2-oxoglutarate dehydrogenase E2 component (dihydrolipoamide succinyltransferase)